ncbi:MAG TPA: SHOCT domain-containing protein [Solirubrobacteraceae bacterium]
MARLQDLGKLHEQGILTDEEFAQQKAKILG